MIMMWRGMLCVSLVYGLGQDSNFIKSEKELLLSFDRPVRHYGKPVEIVQRPLTPPCATPAVTDTRGECNNRAGKRDPSRDKPVDRPSNTRSFSFNAPEMAECVSSGDCAADLCCVRFITGKRCQRIPVEGEACLVRGFKMKRNLGQCECADGLRCIVSSGELSKAKDLGVCLPDSKKKTTKDSREKLQQLHGELQ